MTVKKYYIHCYSLLLIVSVKNVETLFWNN